jgi:uncharacterized membrane protein YjjP (DUF1212 family)
VEVAAASALLSAQIVEASGALRQVFHPRLYYPFPLFLSFFFVACVCFENDGQKRKEKRFFIRIL